MEIRGFQVEEARVETAKRSISTSFVVWSAWKSTWRPWVVPTGCAIIVVWERMEPWRGLGRTWGSVWSVRHCWSECLPPARRPVDRSVPSFFAGWYTGRDARLAHRLAGRRHRLFVLAGAFGSWPGWVGLAVAVASWIGLVVLAGSAVGPAVVVPSAVEQEVALRRRPGLSTCRPTAAAAPCGATPASSTRCRGRPVRYGGRGQHRLRRRRRPRATASTSSAGGGPPTAGTRARLHPRRGLGHRGQAGAGPAAAARAGPPGLGDA